MTKAKLDATLSNRGKTHGEWSDQARISQGIKDLCRQGSSFDKLSPMQKETLDMWAVKMSRIVEGNPNEIDHWLDVEGYGKITRIRMEKEQNNA